MAVRKRVAIFNPEWPPAVAFIRSLGRLGVDVSLYSNASRPAGRYSRYAGTLSRSPGVLRTDEFVDWMADRVSSGEIELVAPTSDYINFAVAEVEDRLGLPGQLQGPSPDAVRQCIHKPSFVRAVDVHGMPGPPTSFPTTLAEAATAAASLGYPVLLKPRSHIGLGLLRGHVIETEADLRELFVVPALDDRHRSALAHDPDLGIPMLQQYRQGRRVEITSISGCLDRDGRVLGLSHCRKLHQWPGALGVGTSFESLPAQPFTERAVELVRDVLGCGLFELEVVHDRDTGETLPIDLNPRGYGQMTLAAATGSDLPALWYGMVTGERVEVPAPVAAPTVRWTSGVQFWTEQAVHLAARPHRAARLRFLASHLRARRVGAVMDWRDPLPGLAYAAFSYRHPRAMLRSFLASGTEPPDGDEH